MSSRAGRGALGVALAVVLGFAADAGAGCTARGEARAVTRAVTWSAKCAYKRLRSGPGARCGHPRTPPECAGTLVDDALVLAYGPYASGAPGVDRKRLRVQLRCQKLIGRAVARYVDRRLSDVVRGRSPETLAPRAQRALRKLPRRCRVPALADAGGVTLPAVGVQCAAAIGDPTDPEALGTCLDTLLGVWVDRAGPEPRALRPNVVFILTDDQRWDTMDATHSPSGAFVMPYTMAALRDQGVALTNAFVTTPICCPSRASILSGQYAHRSGVYTNKGVHGGADDFDDTSSIGVWLQAAGYRTGFYGKYMNGYNNLWDRAGGETPYVPPGWSEWHAFQGAKYYDYRLIERSEDGPVASTRYRDAPEDYSTDVLRKLAVEFIESTPPGQPFLLYLSFKAPHLPRTPAPRHRGMFARIPPWRPVSHNEADVSDKPLWVATTPLLAGAELATLDLTRIRMLEMLQAVDEAIDGPEVFGTKSIMQALRDRGVLDDTIVILLSDNGWQWGEHRLSKKNKPYEESIRTPMLVRYPKLAPLPRVEARFALNIDVAPTLVELAGAVVSPPIVQDGVSLVGLLDGTARGWRTDLLAEGWPASGPWALVREARWKYTELPLVPGDPGTGFERELYDLGSDPFELENLAAAPENAALVTRLAGRLRELRPLWPVDAEAVEEDPDE